MAVYFLRPAAITEFRDSDGVTVTSCLTACDPCEAIEVSESSGREGATGIYLAYYKQATGLCTPSSFQVLVTYDGFGAIGNEFFIIANGVTVWTTGCTVASSSATVTIPAGTTTLYVGVHGACSSTGDDLWSLTVTCL
jgi:hypothetical protein